MVRVGFDVSHLRFALVYNYAGEINHDYTMDYLNVTIGAYFGGGRRK